MRLSRRPRQRVLARAVIGAALALGLSGCGGGASMHQGSAEATVPPATSAAVAGKVAQVLQELGAERLYVMASDNIIHSGLGVVSPNGLEPANTTPRVRLLSNVSSNGRTVVLGAAGVTDGFFLDGAYQLVGDRLVTLTAAGDQKYSLTVSSDGTIAAVGATGFFTRAPGATRWKRDRRLAHAELVEVAWGEGGRAYTVQHSGTPRAQLWEVSTGKPPRRLRPAPCARATIPAPTREMAVTDVERERPGCKQTSRSHLIDLTGHHRDRLLPAGWDPLTWSRDSSVVLLARGHEIAVWQVASGELTDRVDLGVRIWMAAPLWSEG